MGKPLEIKPVEVKALPLTYGAYGGLYAGAYGGYAPLGYGLHGYGAAPGVPLAYNTPLAYNAPLIAPLKAVVGPAEKDARKKRSTPASTEILEIKPLEIKPVEVKALPLTYGAYGPYGAGAYGAYASLGYGAPLAYNAPLVAPLKA